MLQYPSFANVNVKLLERLNAAIFFGGLDKESNKTMIQGTAEAEKLWPGLLTCETHEAEVLVPELMLCGSNVAGHSFLRMEAVLRSILELLVMACETADAGLLKPMLVMKGTPRAGLSPILVMIEPNKAWQLYQCCNQLRRQTIENFDHCLRH